MPSTDDPHYGQPVETGGAAPSDARAALILLHGRGATARGMMALAGEASPDHVLFVAPQAYRRTWYPHSFLAPIEQNEPYLTSALGVVGHVLDRTQQAGIPLERTVLVGFSQGACLALEYAARHPQTYGGVFGLSGGLIRPEDTSFSYDGDLDGTFVFLGCSDQDPHIPLERVQESADVLEKLGARVDARIYSGMGHTTNEEELRVLRETLQQYVPSRSVPVDEEDEDDLLDDELEDEIEDDEIEFFTPDDE